jgi:hypothetical protein
LEAYNDLIKEVGVIELVKKLEETRFEIGEQVNKVKNCSMADWGVVGSDEFHSKFVEEIQVQITIWMPQDNATFGFRMFDESAPSPTSCACFKIINYTFANTDIQMTEITIMRNMGTKVIMTWTIMMMAVVVVRVIRTTTNPYDGTPRG